MEFENIEYDDKDFNIDIEGTHNINLDERIQLKWDKAVEQNLFRYNLNLSKSRILNGKQKYILQLNKERLEERRQPQSLYTMNTPFNPHLFNFHKIDKKEILFNFTNKNHIKKEKNLLLINVSPLEYCHILLIPSIDKCLPQVFTIDASSIAIDFLLLTTQKSWKIGFNSLCAMASVNHLHLHAWIIDHTLSIEKQTGIKLSHNLYLVENEVTRAFAFQLDLSNIDRLKRNVFVVANYLQQNEIAHNIYWVRATSFESQSQTIKAFIWPRKSVFGNKLESEERIIMNVAVAELAGHIPMYVPDLFDVLTEEDIDSQLSGQMLSKEQFTSLTNCIINKLSTN